MFKALERLYVCSILHMLVHCSQWLTMDTDTDKLWNGMEMRRDMKRRTLIMNKS